jgi:hypothetical protein
MRNQSRCIGKLQNRAYRVEAILTPPRNTVWPLAVMAEVVGQFTFKLTPQTTCWHGGKQVTVASIQKGAAVKVTATHEVASRVDIL